MSATTLDPRLPVTPAGERRPSFTRTTIVELRKMLDTRSGFWLPIGVAAITLVTVLISALVNGGQDATIAHLFQNAVLPGAFLLPVMGVLLVCGEWTQRTTLSTFTLIPDRGRVLASKFAASMVVSVGAFLVAIALSVVFAELLPAPGGAGSISGVVLAQGLAYLALAMLMGLAFGAAILVSAPAIVAYLLLPTVWGALASTLGPLKTLDRWLDTGTTLSPLAEHALSAIEWAHAGASLALWVALPLSVGLWRFRRRDVD